MRRNARLVWIAAVVLLIGAHLITTGVWTVRRDEQGIVTRFGKVDRVLTPGIHLTLPWPFESLRRINTREVRQLTIGYRAADGDPSVTRNEAEWLTGDTNIIEVRLVLQYRIADPVRYAYRHGPSGADYLLRKCVETALTERVARISVDDLLTSGKAAVRASVLESTREMMERYETGLQVSSLNIEKMFPPQNVEYAFKEVQSAESDVAKNLLNADGSRSRIRERVQAAAAQTIQVAKSYREDVVQEARGSVDRFERLLVEHRRNPELLRRRLILETLEHILEESPPKMGLVSGKGTVNVRIFR